MNACRWLLLWLGAWGWAAGLEAAEPPLRYRRVYAPADRLKDWPRDDTRYVPMSLAEFERLAGASAARAGDERAPQTSALASATYKAKFAGHALVDGEAVLQIAHDGRYPVRVPLDPCGLAVSEGRWAGAEKTRADLGVGSNHCLEVVVPQAGQLLFSWSLRGRAAGGDAADFAIVLPPCPVNRMLLDLPKGLCPLVEGAVVIREDASGNAQRWRIEAGGRNRLTLRVVSAADVGRSVERLRQSSVCELSLRGADEVVELTLDVPHIPLKQLALELDSGSQLGWASCGQTALKWSSVGPAMPGKSSQLLLEFPTPLQGTGRVVRLGLMAPLELNRAWAVPTVRVKDASWQEGTIAVVVPAPLVLEQTSVVAGRQTRTAPLVAPRVGELAEFQCFTADARVELTIARPRAPLELECGTAVTLSSAEMLSRTVIAARTVEGEHFELAAPVARQWIVDAVEADPAEALSDWESQGGGGGRLVLRLAKAISPARPVRFTVSGHYLYSPLGRTLPLDDLMPLRFSSQVCSHRLVSIRTAEDCTLRVNGAERLAAVELSSLSAAERLLLGSQAGEDDLIYRAGPAWAGVHVVLERQRPTYSAAIRVEATVADGNLTESYTIRCEPRAARVDHLLVQFSPPRPGPLRWDLGPDDPEPLTARPTRLPGQAARGPDGQAWEIRLRRPRTAPFEIHAARTVPLTAEVPLSLASVPESLTQRGTVVVGSADAPLRITNRRLVPVLAEPLPPDRCSVARATFRYDPARDAAASEPAILVSAAVAQNGLSSVWIWQCRLDSRFAPGGQARHVAVYRLENAGGDEIQFTLPAGMSRQDDIRGVWVDEARVPIPYGDEHDPSRLSIALPPDRRFLVVCVCYSTHQERLGLFGRLAPLLPEPDCPVLSRSWTVWLPPGYQSLARSAEWPGGLRPPLTLSERLFGPLGRGTQDGASRPLTAEGWPQWPGGAEDDPGDDQAQTLLERLGRAVATGDAAGRGAAARGPRATSWTSLLTRATEGWDGTLLLDRLAVSQLAGTAPLAASADSSLPPVGRAAALLEQAGLGLWVAGNAVVLTAAIETALNGEGLDSLDSTPAWRVLPGPLGEEIRQALAGQPDSRFVPLAIWKQLPDNPGPPWVGSCPAEQGPGDAAGWNAVRIELPESSGCHLSFVRRDGVRGLGWIAFLSVFAGVWWIGPRRRWTLVAMTGVLAAVAVAVPDAFAPLGSAAILGLLGGLLFALTRGNNATSRSSDVLVPEGNGSGAAPRGTADVAGILAALAIMTGSIAAEAASPKPSPPTPIHQVFIPIDAQDKPLGDRCYVPEALYSQLQQQAAEPHGWQIRDALYRGTLAWQASPEQLTLTELTAGYDLQIVGHSVRVHLPVAWETLAPSPGPLLDGRPIATAGRDPSGELEFEVAEPGRYRLELMWRPTIQVRDRTLSCDVRIPSLATSRLELTFPVDAPPVEVLSAMGAAVAEKSGTRMAVQLGPAERLKIRWPVETERGAAGPAIDAEQLLWLKIRPGAVVLDSRIHLKVLQGRARRIELATDPSLRLLPAEGETPWLSRVESVAGQPQRVRFELARPVADRLTIPASFLLSGSSGVGQFRIPRVDVVGARTTRRWVAITVDPELQHKETSAGPAQAVAVPVFLDAWGPAPEQPQAVFNLSSAADPGWRMSLRPVASRTIADQTLALGFAPAGVQVWLDARLETTAGARFQYRILAPRELLVDRVSVLAAGGEQVVRWSRAEGAVTVLLRSPVSGPHTLSLRGRLPGRMGAMALPLLRLEVEESRSLTIQLFRDAAVQLDLLKPVGLVARESPVAETAASLGRLVASLAAHGTGPVSAQIQVRPNRPKLRGEQITAIRPVGENWELDLVLRGTIADGVLDEFRLEIPAEWPGPYKVEPSMAVKGSEGLGKGGRELVLRPAAALAGNYRVRVCGPLNSSAGDRLSVPRVGLPQAEHTKQIVILPILAQLSPLAWETQGLVPAELPDIFPAGSAARTSLTAFQVVREPFRAVLSSSGRATGTPQVLLADIMIGWQLGGEFSGVAAFDVEPAGQTHCPMELPAGCQLVQVLAAGLPGLPIANGENRWLIPLGPGTLPQRIEVLFQGGTAQPRNDLLQFDAPWLGDWRVQRTLWSISGPAGLHPHDAPASALEQALIRLRTIVSILEQGGEVPAEDPEEMIRWYRPWARRWKDAWNDAHRELLTGEGAETPQAIRAELESLRRRHVGCADRLGTGRVCSEILAAPARPEGAGAVWMWTQSGRGAAGHWVREERADSLGVAWQSAAAKGGQSLWRMVVAIAAMIASVAGLARVGTALASRRWAGWIGVGAGVGWWRWLNPSALGWVIAALGIISWLRQRPPGRSARPPRAPRLG